MNKKEIRNTLRDFMCRSCQYIEEDRYKTYYRVKIVLAYHVGCLKSISDEEFLYLVSLFGDLVDYNISPRSFVGELRKILNDD